MRYRLECLCVDCRQRGLISASKHPDNTLPADVMSYERGVDDYYFANAFIVDAASRERLVFSKLREDAFNTTAMSACCGTLMCGTHPIYDGQSVSVNADSCRVSVPQVIDTQVVLFGCDFPPGKYAEIKRQRNIPMLFSVYDELESETMVDFLRRVKEPIADTFKQNGSTTFEALAADKPVEIDNAFYAESRRGKPDDASLS